MKRAQRDEVRERQWRMKEGIAGEDPETDPDVAPQDGPEVDDEHAHHVDLFGSEGPAVMDTG